MVHVASAEGRHKMHFVDAPTSIITVNTCEASSNNSSSPSPSSSNSSNTIFHKIITEESNPNGYCLKMNANQENANFLVDNYNSSNQNMNKKTQSQTQIASDGLALISHGLTDSVCETLKLLDSENENENVVVENKVFTEELVIKKTKGGIMKNTVHSCNTISHNESSWGTKGDEIMEDGSLGESNDSEDLPLLPSGDSSTEAIGESSNQKSVKLGNGSKQTGLKRVSFGSSKGSMVETLVYETPIPEENEKAVKTANGTSNNEETNDESAAGGSREGSRPPSRVRVTFFESERPLALSSPDSELVDFDLSNMTLPGSPAVDHTPTYNRQIRMPSMSVAHRGILYYVVKIPRSEFEAMSPDSDKGGTTITNVSGPVIKVDSEGWDNPFRPDGDLSKEADQIVELIKEGKPINEETLRSKSPSVNESFNVSHTNPLHASSPKKGTNGVNGSGSPDTVQHGVVPPAGQAGQVEHVVLKKKKGCCVIQ